MARQVGRQAVGGPYVPSSWDSGDGRTYDLQVVFAKSGRAASYVGLSLSGNAAGYSARAAAPIPGVAVALATRRIGFSNVVLDAGGANAATLNGTLITPPTALRPIAPPVWLTPLRPTPLRLVHA